MLDCYDIDSTLASFTGAIGVSAEDLRSGLLEHDEARFDDSEAPYTQMPRQVLADLGVEVDSVHFDGAYYFHGTRAIDPESFRLVGILPLDATLEGIWTTLRELAHECSDAEWASFRGWIEAEGGDHSGYLYRHKTGGRIHYGPHGELVRAIFLDPTPSGSHDYLGCPEIVQDIARCAESFFGFGLEDRFCEASAPCLVKFRAPLWSGAVPTSLWSLYELLREGHIGSRNSCGGFAGGGTAVPPNDVAAVEIVESWKPRRY